MGDGIRLVLIFWWVKKFGLIVKERIGLFWLGSRGEEYGDLRIKIGLG